VHFDLARDVVVARTAGRVRTLLFGTPSTEPQRAWGFVRPERVDLFDPEAWLLRDAWIHLNLAAVADRGVILDLEPYPGLGSLSVEATLNDRPIGGFRLEGRRERVFLRLRRAFQERGLNELKLLFDRTAPRRNPTGRRVAAALRGMTLGDPVDPVFLSLLSKNARPPLAAVRSRTGVDLVQAGPGSIRYAFGAPLRAEARGMVRLDGGEAPARVTIRLERDGEVPRTLWSRVLRARGAPAVFRVPLGVPRGTPVVLVLEIEDERPLREAVWVRWTSPRVVGFGEPEVLVPEASGPFHEPAPSPPPGVSNVLLVVLDAARARDFGCYGYTRATTPEIDRIAREGVVFEKAYTTGCYTRAGMGSLWTSQFPDDHGAVGPEGRLAREPFPTLGEVLAAGGLRTAAFVANPVAGRAFGFDRGFEDFHDVYARSGIEAEGVTESLVPWLAQNAAERFFVYAHFREPHFPYDPPPPFDTLFGPEGPLAPGIRRDRDWIFAANDGSRPLTADESRHMVRLYDGNLAHADREVGRIREALESLGLWDRTAVIVTADHGEALGEHGYIMHNQQLYEESVRIPMIVRLPSGAAAGLRPEGLVDLTDLAPTIADILGVRQGTSGFRGRSLLPLVRGAPGKPFVFARSLGDRPKFSIRDERYTFIYDSRWGAEELYDRAFDPGEHRKLGAGDRVQAAVYRARLWRWMDRLARRDVTIGAGERLSKREREQIEGLGYVD
jgi:arylsulfatase A-like enzyme